MQRSNHHKLIFTLQFIEIVVEVKALGPICLNTVVYGYYLGIKCILPVIIIIIMVILSAISPEST